MASRKGKQNKTTVITKGTITRLLSDYEVSGLMAEDFMALEPRDRMHIAEKMMQYVMPKMQATSMDVTVAAETKSLEEKLSALAGENE